MVGTVTFAAVPITARLTMIAARRIISIIGSYYAVCNPPSPDPRGLQILTILPIGLEM